MQLTSFDLKLAAAQCQPITEEYREIWLYLYQTIAYSQMFPLNENSFVISERSQNVLWNDIADCITS